MAEKYRDRKKAILLRILINTVRSAKGMDLLPSNPAIGATGKYENGRLVLREKGKVRADEGEEVELREACI